MPSKAVHKLDLSDCVRRMTEMVVVDGPDLVERRRRLMENCDCFVIMPGGAGTFDETWECISNYQVYV